MILNLLLTHQSPPEVAAMLAFWQKSAPRDSLLVAYGGSAEDFEAIAHPHKVFVQSAQLRTRDHQREKQSYEGVYAAALRWLEGRDFSHVHLAEFDHLPLVDDLNARQLAQMEHEQADVLGFRLRRVDGTSYPHALYHAADPRFARFWQALSCRAQSEVVLRMFATGSLWSRQAFEAVARRPEPFPIYLEIYLPTLAHHLGFRVRDWGAQSRFMHYSGDLTDQIEQARAAGAWSLHPVKGLWSRG